MGEDTCEKPVKLPVQYEVHVHVYPQLACQLEARSDAPMAVDLVLAAIQKLYRIEARAKAEAMSLEARLELGQREAKPIWQLTPRGWQEAFAPKSPVATSKAHPNSQIPILSKMPCPSDDLGSNMVEDLRLPDLDSAPCPLYCPLDF